MKKLIYILLFFCLNGFVLANSELQKSEDFGIHILDQEKIKIDLLNTNNEKISAWLKVANYYFEKRIYKKGITAVYFADQLVNDDTNKKLIIDISLKRAWLYLVIKLNVDSFKNLDGIIPVITDLPNSEFKQISLARYYTTKAMLYSDENKKEEAFEHLKTAINLIKNINTKEAKTTKSLAYRQLAYTLIELKKYQNVEEYFFAALKYAQSINDNELIAYTYRGLGNYSLINNQTNQSVNYLLEAKDFANKTDNYNLKIAIEENLSSNYLSLNDWTNYKTSEQLLQKLQFDSYMNIQEAIQQSLYLKDIEDTKPLKIKIIIAYISLIVLTSLIGFLVWLIIKEKKIQNKIIYNQSLSTQK